MQAVTGPGHVVAGRYELLGAVGRGAMGTVWRARDLRLAREVAVKEVRLPGPASEQDRFVLRERSLREARVAARLSHPGVVTVHDVIEADSGPWIIMELVPSRSLAQVLAEEGPMPPVRAAAMGLTLLDALGSAHAAGIVHRDVKPGNILVSDGGRAVLTDFGIATLHGEPGLTQAGMVMGTPGFCAPERVRGEPASPASDLWSLGATLYAAVEGRGPFEGQGSAMAILAAIVHGDSPTAARAGALGTVIAALMRRDPSARPDAATARRMLAAAYDAAGAAGAAAACRGAGTAEGLAGECADLAGMVAGTGQGPAGESVGLAGMVAGTGESASPAGTVAGTGQGPAGESAGPAGTVAGTGQGPAGESASPAGAVAGTGQGPAGESAGPAGTVAGTGQGPAAESAGPARTVAGTGQGPAGESADPVGTVAAAVTLPFPEALSPRAPATTAEPPPGTGRATVTAGRRDRQVAGPVCAGTVAAEPVCAGAVAAEPAVAEAGRATTLLTEPPTATAPRPEPGQQRRRGRHRRALLFGGLHR
jgi:tRNA A-37 threonylcarbamoyl transferase component Bud32